MAVALVLGARGFLGRHVSAALSTVPGLDVVASWRPGADRVALSGGVVLDLVRDRIETVARVLGDVGPTVLVNCTGSTVGSPTELVSANVVAVARLLDAYRLSGVQARLVHLGSAAEYGSGPVGVPVAEATPPAPVSAYGVTKLAATQLVALARQRDELDTIVLRVFNPIGPGMPDHTLPGAMARRFAEAQASGASVVETGPLGAVRDFIDVRDVGAAVVAATVAPSLKTPVVNVGSGRPCVARELVERLARETGYGGSIEERGQGSPRSWDVPWQVADISLARVALGWQPREDLASACRSVVGRDQAARHPE